MNANGQSPTEEIMTTAANSAMVNGDGLMPDFLLAEKNLPTHGFARIQRDNLPRPPELPH